MRVLQSNEQYKVVEEEGVVQIFSYQFLSNLNYIYGVKGEILDNVGNNDNIIYNLRNSSDVDKEILSDVLYYTNPFFHASFSYSKDEEVIKNYMVKNIENNSEVAKIDLVVKKIVDEINSKSNTEEEKIKMVVEFLNEYIEYDKKSRNDIYGALVLKKSMCTGYAWNYVYLSGRWYI